MKKIKKLLSLLFSASIGGLLGSLGGTDGVSKSVRRFGIPIIITLFALCTLHNRWCISIMFMSFALAMGYGIPDIRDAGSTLGQFWARIFPYHVLLKTPKDRKLRLLADIFTRATIGVLICISMLVVPILRGNWGIFSLCSIGIIGVYALVSWRGLGTFKFNNKRLLWSEFWTYSCLVIMAQIMIKL